MNFCLNFSLILLSGSYLAHADIAANFTDGSGNAAVDQYQGIAGAGWASPWGTSTPGGGNAVTVAVANTTPINASGNYLKASSSFVGDNAVGRTYVTTGAPGVNSALTTTTTLSLRVDTLAGFDSNGDYLTVHGTSSVTPGLEYNVSSASSFIIRAFGAAPSGTTNGSEWLLYNGASDAGLYSTVNFVNSGMPMVAGTTYTFTIVSNPTTKKYSGSISNGTTSVNWTDLGWRSSAAPDKLGFNQRVSVETDVISYSLDNILISDGTTTTTDYYDWAGPSGFNLTGGPSEDDDNDGISNLLEYALDGLNPTQPNASPGTYAGSILSFNKRPLANTNGDALYSIETSTDLGVSDSWEVTSSTQDADSIEAAIPNASLKNFARLRVNLTSVP